MRMKACLRAALLAGRLINADEDEQRHIARELHDDIGQRLSLFSVHPGRLGDHPPT